MTAKLCLAGSMMYEVKSKNKKFKVERSFFIFYKPIRLNMFSRSRTLGIPKRVAISAPSPTATITIVRPRTELVMACRAVSMAF